MSYLEKMDRYFDSLKIGKSAMVDSWFMMSSPFPILSVVVLYLIFIRIGPRIMKNRSPLRITKLISYYNASQVVLAAMLCIKVFKLNLFRDGILYAGCRYPSNTQNPMLLDLGWWYFFAKFTELLDTVFFVLRKKDKQLFRYFWTLFFNHLSTIVLLGTDTWFHPDTIDIRTHGVLRFISVLYITALEFSNLIIFIVNSVIIDVTRLTFLHVYHHVIMALYSWSYLKFAAGGEGAVLALLNSIVHVVMYTYYFLSGLGPRFQKYLWWKKYVTKMQLIQFGLMLMYCAWTHFSPRCQYAPGFTYFISINVSIFLLLFLNFYSKNYKIRQAAQKQNGNVQNGFKSNNNDNKCNGTTDKCDKKENGVCKEAKNGTANIEEIPFEVNKACGDYVKNGKVFLTRRTAKAAYGPEYDFDSIIKK